MISTPATAHDFARWAKQAKALGADSLRYVVEDCRQAAEAMKGWNPEREGFYRDQSSTFGQELTRRKQ